MTGNSLKHRRHTQRGFTLIEMAVVIVIVGILLAAGLKAASVQRDSAAYSATRTKQQAIKEALINYLRNNRRLPCPDSKAGWGNDVVPGAISFAIATPPDGIENRATPIIAGVNQPDVAALGTDCDVAFGVLPWTTLGLPRDAAIDGFGNFFTYHIAPNHNWAVTANFVMGVPGGLIIQDRNAGGLVAAAVAPVVVVVSHGANGLGAYTIKGTQNQAPAAGTDELENADGNVTYVRRFINNDAGAAGGAYDDVLLVLTPDDLLGPLTHEQSFKSYQSEVNDARQTITDIKDALVGYAVANNVLPSADNDGNWICGGVQDDGIADGSCNHGNIPWATLGVARTDPWGGNYKYAVTSNLTSANPALPDKATFLATNGDRFIGNAAGNIVSTSPFVVYSLGRNNSNYFLDAAGNGAPCTVLAPAAPPDPAVAPNCLGGNENNARTGADVASQFIQQAITLPPNVTPQNVYDDILDFVSKNTLNGRFPP